jgi:protein TonB
MRRSFTLFSIVVHAIVISAALIAQVLAVGALPIPHQPVIFASAAIMPVDVHIPAPPRRPAPSAPASMSINAAPIAPPEGVTEETRREGVAERSEIREIDEVEGNTTSLVDGIGVAPTAPPPPPERVPLPTRLPSGIKAPVKTVEIAPVYPVMARNAHVQGTVILEAVVDANGRVEDVRVLRSIPLLDQAAADAVRQWRYTPTLLNGRAIPIVLTVTVSFTLQ